MLGLTAIIFLVGLCYCSFDDFLAVFFCSGRLILGSSSDSLSEIDLDRLFGSDLSPIATISLEISS
jgi:hypothetical protein